MLDFDTYSEIHRQFAKKYDELIESALKPYRITRADILTGCDRVFQFTTGDFNRHFFIDEVYAFSIVTEYSFDYISNKAMIDCRVEVIEKMKGEKAEI